jgi:hypothetical protein
MPKPPKASRRRSPVAAPADHTGQSRWVRWLESLPAWAYLLAAIAVAGLIGGVALWLDERSLAMVACLAFAGLMGRWILTSTREWREAEPLERIISVLGALLLLGATAANFVRFLLLA